MTLRSATSFKHEYRQYTRIDRREMIDHIDEGSIARKSTISGKRNQVQVFSILIERDSFPNWIFKNHRLRSVDRPLDFHDIDLLISMRAPTSKKIVKNFLYSLDELSPGEIKTSIFC